MEIAHNLITVTGSRLKPVIEGQTVVILEQGDDREWYRLDSFTIGEFTQIIIDGAETNSGRVINW